QSPLSENYFTRDVNKAFICSTGVTNKKYNLVYPSAKLSYKDVLYFNAFSMLLDLNPQGPFVHRLVKNKMAAGFYMNKIFWLNSTYPIEVNFELTEDQDFMKVKQYWFDAVQEVLSVPFDTNVIKMLIKNSKVETASVVEKMTTLLSGLMYSEMFFKNFLIANEEEKLFRSMNQNEFRKWIRENLDPNKMYLTGVVPIGDASVECKDLISTCTNNCSH
ncbi:MAG: hypothetical protein K2X39_05330, partial [Silvanigrellaceae bacterium]|nr:hypothetical protein [Silvanigrellaceae bacterium]